MFRQTLASKRKYNPLNKKRDTIKEHEKNNTNKDNDLARRICLEQKIATIKKVILNYNVKEHKKMVALIFIRIIKSRKNEGE